MFARIFISLFFLLVAGAFPIVKRGSSGEATFYAVGLGACGNVNSDHEMVVALNAPMWDGGANCGKSLTINLNGKTAQATVVDLCPGCAYGDLDMSPSLFDVFNDRGVGRFKMDWSWNDGSGGGSSGGGSSSSSEQQQSSSKKEEPPAPPSSTWSPEPTSTWTPPPSSSSETPTSTWTPPSSSSTAEPSSSSTSSETPSPSPSSSSTAASSTTTSSSSSSSSSSSASSAVPSSSVSSSLSSSSTSQNSTSSSTSTSTTSSSTMKLPDVSAETPNDSVVSDGENTGNLAQVNELVVSLGRLVVAGAGGFQ